MWFESIFGLVIIVFLFRFDMHLGRIAKDAKKTNELLAVLKVYVSDNEGFSVGNLVNQVLKELRLAAQERYETKQDKPYRDR